ncbi:FG-GAP-like repeat-containing protein [Streptomyces sp. NRRL F-5123]|uniref:FG-GAP-like repeat-containing protein n=1 Tax=Streptomyces sp. NRRL F-5123 TaxID=1463856 RepID=UPI003B63EEC7
MWAGNGDGTFGAARQVTSGWNFTQTAAADFDGNGKADIIARDTSGNLKIWAGHGDGTFGAAAQLTTGWDFTQTAAADFNGDGQADIIARDSTPPSRSPRAGTSARPRSPTTTGTARPTSSPATTPPAPSTSGPGTATDRSWHARRIPAPRSVPCAPPGAGSPPSS